MTIVEFLEARISEDKALARSASPGPWHVDAESTEVLAVDGIVVADGFALSGPQTRATTAHIARHDSARVLAECEAKRRIVGLHESRPDWPDCQECGDRDYTKPWPCSTLRLLALPYADHPDYRPEWRTRAPEYQD